MLHRTSPRYAPGITDSDRISATLLALVRNEELEGMVEAMKDLERTWNHKFNYPWTFFNDVPFSDEFKRQTSAATNAECRYGTLLPQIPHRYLPSLGPVLVPTTLQCLPQLALVCLANRSLCVL